MAADRARRIISPRKPSERFPPPPSPTARHGVVPPYLSFIISGTRRCADTSIR